MEFINITWRHHTWPVHGQLVRMCKPERSVWHACKPMC